MRFPVPSCTLNSSVIRTGSEITTLLSASKRRETPNQVLSRRCEPKANFTSIFPSDGTLDQRGRSANPGIAPNVQEHLRPMLEPRAPLVLTKDFWC